MKKRILSFALAVVLLLSLLPFAASAAEIVEQGTCGDNITWTLDSDGLLTISGTGELKGSPFQRNPQILDAVIESGITGVLYSTFDDCENLRSVSLPEGITEIGQWCFRNCSALTKVSFPSSLKTIGEDAFRGCISLKSVSLPEGLLRLEEYAFADCSSLTEVTLPKSLTYFGGRMYYYRHPVFSNTSSLERITVAEGNVTFCSVDGVLFSRDQTELVEYPGGRAGAYTIPEGVTEVRPWAFQNCGKLTELTLPASLTAFSAYFTKCTSLRSFHVDDGSEAFSTLDGVLLSKDQTQLFYYPIGRQGTYTIPESVSSVRQGAFDHASGLTEVTIPNARAVETTRFLGCENLQSVTLQGDMTVIPDEMFSRCASLKQFEIPESVSAIGMSAFYGCSSLKSIVIPEQVTKIGMSAFSGCTGLEQITLPAQVTEIGGIAFGGCTGLEHITIPAQVTEIGNGALQLCSGLKTVTILSRAPHFGQVVFIGCSALEDVFFAGDEEAWHCDTTVETQGEGNKPFGMVDATRVHLNVADPETHIRTVEETFSNGTVVKHRSCSCGYAFPDVTETLSPGTEGIPRSPDLYSWITSDGTRYGLAHLLWYIAGEPQPVSAENPFLDVSEAMAPPVLWAVERGVLEPASENFFDLDLGLTRAEVVSAVWKYAGSPQPTIHAFPFTDVDLSAWYSQALLWAYEVGALRFEKMGTQFHPDEAVASMRLEPADGVLDMQGYAEDDMLPAQGRWFNYLLYNSSKTARLTGCWTVTQGDIVIPKTIGDGMYYVSEIGSKALRGRDQITSITIPSDVRKIGAFAFDGCTGLTDVYYGGCSPEGWNSILISGGNDPLLRARIHYSAHEYEANGRDDEGRIIYVCLRCHDTIKGVEKTTDSGVKLLAETGNHEAAPEIRLVARENTAETAGAANVVLQTVAETTQTRAFDIHLENAAGEAVQPEAAVTVTIPVPAGWDPNNVAVYYADPATGKTENMNARVSGDGRSVSFRTTHFSCYVLALKAKSDTTHTPSNPFSDVSAGAYYYDPVLWAVNHTPQITKGTGENTFSPGSTCTRGQVVTFLWRAMGCPNPKSTSNPFTDVKATDYYYQAVLWASENGITAGTSKTTFSPGSPCTRAHVVTFLWRAHGKPSAGASNPFRDVPAGQYYTDAVLWAVNHTPQITQGTGTNTFSPNNPCTRGQIVTFLYRDLK